MSARTEPMRVQMGTPIRALDARIAELFAWRQSAMVNSGASALQLAVGLLALPSGSDVITLLLAFASSASHEVRAERIPSFVNLEPASSTSTPSRLRQ